MSALRLLALALPLLAFAGAAHADEAAANQCASNLTGDSKTIYDAVAPNVTADTNLKDAITSQTKSMVMAGTVSRSDARAAAQAAAGCLKLLQK
jgi:hypothetical protein